MRGMFLVIEGINKAGKDTQAPKVKKWLEDLGYTVELYFEPNDREVGGSPLGYRIRDILQRKVKKPDDFIEFQRMFILDRGQDIFCFIKPAIEKGHICIFVRYKLSTIAFGAASSGKPMDLFTRMHEEILGPSLALPDLTIILDISAEESMRRSGRPKNDSGQLIERRYVQSNDPELFERRGLQERIRQNYLELANDPKRDHPIIVVNGKKPEEVVFEDIKNILLCSGKLPPLS